MAPSQVQPLGYLDPFVTITGYRVTPVVAVVDPEFVPVPQPSEVAEVFEVPLDYLMAPDSLRQVEINHRGRIRHVLSMAGPASASGGDRGHPLQPASPPGASAMNPIKQPWTTLVDVDTLAAALGEGAWSTPVPPPVPPCAWSMRVLRWRTRRLRAASTWQDTYRLRCMPISTVICPISAASAMVAIHCPTAMPLPRNWGSGASASTPRWWSTMAATAAWRLRLWWLLRLIGHTKVAVLDGGIAAWQCR